MSEYKSVNELMSAVVEAAELPEFTNYLKQFFVRAVPSLASKYNIPQYALFVKFVDFFGFVRVENLTQADFAKVG